MTEAFQEAEEPEIESLDDEEDEEFKLVEPPDATRVSPYAIASLVVAVLGVYETPVSLTSIAYLTTGAFGPGRLIFQKVISTLLPIALAVIALWLAARAEDEIFVQQGGACLGGVGLYRAARLIAVVFLVFVIGLMVLAFFLPAHGFGSQ